MEKLQAPQQVFLSVTTNASGGGARKPEAGEQTGGMNRLELISTNHSVTERVLVEQRHD